MSAHFSGWRRAAGLRPRRHDLGKMNRLEQSFEAEVLVPLRAAGEVLWWVFESQKLRLADKTWYTVDFFVQPADLVLELVELKPWSRQLNGPFWEEDARLKWKTVAQEYQCYRVLAATLAPDGWRIDCAFSEDRDAARRYGTLLRSPGSEVDGVGRAAGAERKR